MCIGQYVSVMMMFKYLYKLSISINKILCLQFTNLIRLCFTLYIFITFLKPFHIQNNLHKYSQLPSINT